MKKFIYTIIGIVLLSLSSCSDFLEPKSQSEYVPKDANALQEMQSAVLTPNISQATIY